MGPIEISILCLVLLIFLSIISRYIYRKIKKIPVNTCDCGKHKMNGKKLVEEYRKKYNQSK